MAAKSGKKGSTARKSTHKKSKKIVRGDKRTACLLRQKNIEMREPIVVARVRREINAFQKKDDCQAVLHITDCQGIILKLDGNDLMKLKAEIDGPPDTPYAGGKYQLAIEIPSTYPFHPPKVRFTTHLWHPNISFVTGAICLGTLPSRWGAGWPVAMTLRTVLLHIQALLESPEPDDPQDAVVAQQYTSNRGMWQSTALFWAQHFAGAPGAKNDQFNRNFQKVCEMGVDRKKALDALSQHNWNMDAAAKFLFN